MRKTSCLARRRTRPARRKKHRVKFVVTKRLTVRAGLVCGHVLDPLTTAERTELLTEAADMIVFGKITTTQEDGTDQQ